MKVKLKYSTDIVYDNDIGINTIKNDLNCDSISNLCSIVTDNYAIGGLKFEKLQQASNRIDFDYSI